MDEERRGNGADNISGPDSISINLVPNQAWPLAPALNLFLPGSRRFTYFQDGDANGRGIIQHVDIGQLVEDGAVYFPQDQDAVGSGNPNLQYLPLGATAHDDRPPVGVVDLDPVYIEYDKWRGHRFWDLVRLSLFLLAIIPSIILASSYSSLLFSSSVKKHPGSINSSLLHPVPPSLLDIRIQMHHLAAENAAFAAALSTVASSPGLRSRLQPPDLGPLSSPQSLPFHFAGAWPGSGSGSPPSSRLASGSIPDHVRALWSGYLPADMNTRRQAICETLLADFMPGFRWDMNLAQTDKPWNSINSENFEEHWVNVTNHFMAYIHQPFKGDDKDSAAQYLPLEQDIVNEIVSIGRAFHICTSLGKLTMAEVDYPVHGAFGLPGFVTSAWSHDRRAGTPLMNGGPEFVRRLDDLLLMLCSQPILNSQPYDILMGIVSMAKGGRWIVNRVGSSVTDNTARTWFSSWMSLAMGIFNQPRKQQIQQHLENTPTLPNLTIDAVVLQIINETAYRLDKALEIASSDLVSPTRPWHILNSHKLILWNMADDAAELVRVGKVTQEYDRALLAMADRWIAASLTVLGYGEVLPGWSWIVKSWDDWLFALRRTDRDDDLAAGGGGEWTTSGRGSGRRRKPVDKGTTLVKLRHRRERIHKAASELQELGRWEREYLDEVANLEQQIHTALTAGYSARKAAQQLQDMLKIVFAEFSHTGRLRLAGSGQGIAWELVQERFGVEFPETTGEFLDVLQNMLAHGVMSTLNLWWKEVDRTEVYDFYREKFPGTGNEVCELWGEIYEGQTWPEDYWTKEWTEDWTKDWTEDWTEW